MEKEKKGSLNIGVIVVAVVVFFIAFILGVYNGYYRIANEEVVQNNNDSVEIVVENLDVLSDIVQNNFNKFMTAVDHYTGTAHLYFKSERVTTSDIDNRLAYLTIADDYFNNKSAVSADEISNKIKEYFGSDYNYQHQSFSACVNHNYNAETNSYVYVETACGGTSGPNAAPVYRVSKAYLEEDLLVLNVKVLFPGKDYDSNGYHKYYSDAALTEEIKDLSYQTMNVYPSEAPVLETDENLAKGGDYKFVMKKVSDGVYSFVSSEPVM